MGRVLPGALRSQSESFQAGSAGLVKQGSICYVPERKQVQVRITGGRARGITLVSGGRDDVRPATDRTREALFSSLGPAVVGARCLDLFAGTGAYGLEALSRGASSVRLVELNNRSATAITKNVVAVTKSMQAGPDVARVERRDVFSWDPGWERYDIVFADPPYALLPARAHDIFRVALSALAAGGRLCFEMPGSEEPTHPSFTLVRRLGKGRHQPSVCIYELVA